MNISADIVGREAGANEQQVDSRWIMAYNAALGEVSEVPHPLFPVCYEWPCTRALRERAGLAAIDARLVHAQHDLTLHKELRAGTVRVAGQVVAAYQRKPGTLVVMRFVSRDAQGDLISTTDFSALYRDLKLDGADRAIGQVQDPPRHEKAMSKIGEIAVPATAAHVYTECARIWNPIHTDPAYARDAGLPGIILHGTATLAFSVSRVVREFKPRSVRRVLCRFAGMVLMPSTLSVHASREGDAIAFETRNESGAAVIERGWIS